MLIKIDPVVALHVISIGALVARFYTQGGLSNVDYTLWVLAEICIFLVWCILENTSVALSAENDKKLRVLSWNLMAYEPTDDRRNLLYGTKADDERFRQMINILTTILERDGPPDIVLFQEVRLGDDEGGVTKKRRDDLCTFMHQRGYDGLLHQLNKTRANKIGNATFWLREKLNGVVGGNNSGDTSQLHNASIECVLQWRPYGRPDSTAPLCLYVANVHFKAGLRTHGGERLAQLHRCLARVQKENDKGAGCLDYCIMGGDFNDDLAESDGGGGPESSLLVPVLRQHGFINTGQQDNMDTCCVYGQRWWPCDHVLVSSPLSDNNRDANGPRLTRQSISVLTTPLPSRPLRIPCAIYPSDHFPVLATLSL